MHQLLLDVPAVPGALASRWLALLLAPFEAGWIGVQLFFVLSGFLITGILLDTKDADSYWSSFFARRALRILPPYYILLSIIFLMVPILWHQPPAVDAANGMQGWYWLYLTNWRFLGHGLGHGGQVTPLGHTWSLAVEEQFYLLWPFVVRRTSTAGLARVSFAIAAGALALRIALVVLPVEHEIIYECTLTRADALALGALVAILVRRPDWLERVVPRLGWAGRATLIALGATALASGGLLRRNPLTLTAGHTVLAVASALLILLVVLQTAYRRGRLASWLASPWLRRFGKHSYAIYVFHLPLHLLAEQRLLLPRLAGAGTVRLLLIEGLYLTLGPMLLLALGVVFYRFVEGPILALKRFFPARRGARAA